MSSPRAARGTRAKSTGRSGRRRELEQLPDARVRERRHDEVRGGQIEAREGRARRDGHPRGAGGADAGRESSRATQRPGRRRGGRRPRGRRRAPAWVHDLLGADDGVEAFEPPADRSPRVQRSLRPEFVARPIGTPCARSAATSSRAPGIGSTPVPSSSAWTSSRNSSCSSRPRPGWSRWRSDRLARLTPRRAEHLALVVERELGAVARVEGAPRRASRRARCRASARRSRRSPPRACGGA